MADINRATILGNVTRPPEVRYTGTGKAVCNFSVATNEGQDQNGSPKVSYHSIVAWDKLAELCNQYLRKGSKVFVDGRLSYRDYVAADGNKRYITEIVASNVIFTEKKIVDNPIITDESLKEAGLI